MDDEVAPSLPPTCSPSVWLWPGGALYLGAPLPLGTHSGAVACFVLAVDGTVDVDVAGDPSGGVRDVGSVLVPARVRHRLTSRATCEAITYLDTGAGPGRDLVALTRATAGPLRTDHRDEVTLRDAARHLGSEASLEAVRRFTTGVASRTQPPEDPLVAALVDRLLGEPAAPWTAATAAAELGLSTSRLLHRFRDVTGTSYRRFRVWARLLAAGRAVASGEDLTGAAHRAGFASSAHLSTAFARTFGLPPSRMLRLGTTLHVLDEDPRTAVGATTHRSPDRGPGSDDVRRAQPRGMGVSSTSSSTSTSSVRAMNDAI